MSTAAASPELAAFYHVGGTVPRDARSYVSRHADTELLDALRRGEFCYVLTARQMGKSSLMTRAAVTLRAEGAAVAVLDLTAFGTTLRLDQWYDLLLNRIGRQLHLEDELEDFWLEQERLPPLARFVRALEEVVLPRVPGRLVLFVDEIDVVRSLGFNTDEFFAALRELYTRRAEEPQWERVAVCLLGVASPADLIRDARITPFNIGRRIELRDFTAEEAAPLAAGLGQNGPALLARILHWTHGHPFLTQKLCAALREKSGEEREKSGRQPESTADAGTPALTPTATVPPLTPHSSTLSPRPAVPPLTPHSSPLTSREVDRLCHALFLDVRAREGEDNLRFVADRLLRGTDEPEAVLALYAKVRRGEPVTEDPTDPVEETLRLAGIVRGERGRLVVRNRIYAQVFDSKWIAAQTEPAEARRQREAERRGRNRVLALAGAVLVVMAVLAGFGFHQAGRASANAGMATANARMAEANAAKERTARQEAEAQRRRADAQRTRVEKLAAERSAALRDATRQKDTATRERNQAVAARAAESRALAEARAQRSAALAAQTLAEQRAKEAAAAAAKEQTARREAAARAAEAAREASAAQRASYIATLNLIQREWEAGPDRIARVLELLEETRPNPHRGFEWGYWHRLCHLDLLTLKGHTSGVNAVAFAPDGKRVLTGSGSLIGRGGDNTAKLWDAATGQEVLTLKGHTRGVNAVAFAPDGKRVLTGSDDHTAKLWDAATGREVLTLKGHTGSVGAVAFAPEGRRVLTGSLDGTAKLRSARR